MQGRFKRDGSAAAEQEPQGGTGPRTASSSPQHAQNPRGPENPTPSPGGEASGPTARTGGPSGPTGGEEPKAALKPTGPVDTGSRIALRNWRISTRLVALLALPVVAATTLGGLRIEQSMNDMQQLDHMQLLTDMTKQATELAAALQTERDDSAGPLSTADLRRPRADRPLGHRPGQEVVHQRDPGRQRFGERRRPRVDPAQRHQHRDPAPGPGEHPQDGVPGRLHQLPDGRVLQPSHPRSAQPLPGHGAGHLQPGDDQADPCAGGLLLRQGVRLGPARDHRRGAAGHQGQAGQPDRARPPLRQGRPGRRAPGSRLVPERVRGQRRQRHRADGPARQGQLGDHRRQRVLAARARRTPAASTRSSGARTSTGTTRTPTRSTR